MPEKVQVYWSFRSPYSYLVTPDLIQLRDKFDIDIELKVVLPIVVRSKESLFNKDNKNRISRFKLLMNSLIYFGLAS